MRRQEERRLRLLQRAVEAASSGVALLDARSSEYEVAFANPAFLRLTGYAAARRSSATTCGCFAAPRPTWRR